jgi:hypothetical protein
MQEERLIAFQLHINRRSNQADKYFSFSTAELCRADENLPQGSLIKDTRTGGYTHPRIDYRKITAVGKAFIPGRQCRLDVAPNL